MMMSLFIAEEERVTSYSGRGESRISRVYYKYHIRSSCSECAGESMSKRSCKIVKLGAQGLDKDCGLPKEKLKSLTERLRRPLSLSGIDNFVERSLSRPV